MKKAILTFSFVLAVSNLARASEQLCGVLESYVVSPHCVVGRPCPHWVKLQYDLRLEDARAIDLETTKAGVLQDFGANLGANICVEGSFIGSKFEVTKID